MKSEAKCRQIKNHLREGRYITGLIAMQIFGVYRLSSVINRLRNEGMDIKTEMVSTQSGTTYAKYYLNV